MFGWLKKIFRKKTLTNKLPLIIKKIITKPLISQAEKKAYYEKRQKARKHIMELVDKGIMGDEYIQAKKAYYEIKESYEKDLKLRYANS